MNSKRVFIARFIPDEYLVQARAACQVDLWPDDLPPPREVLLERVKGVDGILSLLTDKIDPAVMDAAGPGLKVISNCAVGFDNVDVSEATRRGIPVGNTPGVLTDTTADFAFALLMAAARRVVEGHNYVQSGRWKTWGLTQLLGQDIAGATLGIIGFGRIGKAVAKRAFGFDMRILYYDPTCEDDPYAAQIGAHCVDMDTILRQSDHLSLHVPLYKDTFHFIGEAELAKMKPTAVLVNTARGGVVDPDALYRALRDGVIGYAALDVTEPEPIPHDHPLLSLENLIIAPHIASASVQTRGKMIEIALANLLAGVRGEQLNHCVNPQVYMTDLE
jgi:lactate dehydrogenase-like 2-hydroxyacid dehydrogenase